MPSCSGCGATCGEVRIQTFGGNGNNEQWLEVARRNAIEEWNTRALVKVTHKEQLLAIFCAYADLSGALQTHEQNKEDSHDWIAHAQTMNDLVAAFPEFNLGEVPK